MNDEQFREPLDCLRTISTHLQEIKHDARKSLESLLGALTDLQSAIDTVDLSVGGVEGKYRIGSFYISLHDFVQDAAKVAKQLSGPSSRIHTELELCEPAWGLLRADHGT